MQLPARRDAALAVVKYFIDQECLITQQIRIQISGFRLFVAVIAAPGDPAVMFCYLVVL
jgi:hypothetical protein